MDCAVKKSDRHPCFSLKASHKYARMHLPVAPHCNISCNYCSRKFDCLHESRPGVTSEILSPEAALEKYKFVKDRLHNISVVGIAGPGDALANWEKTRLTISLIKQSDPDVLFCLSTNGLMLPHYEREIIDLGVRHVTVTVNCLSTDIGEQIYRFINYKGKRYEGGEGAGILIENQLSGIEYLAAAGATVKVNIVMIKGINDNVIPDIVKKVKDLGAFITNIMPLIPARGSLFENMPQTCMKEINRMRNICRADLRQMYHCKQCRADAIGLLGNDRSLEFSSNARKEANVMNNECTRDVEYRIAVASEHG